MKKGGILFALMVLLACASSAGEFHRSARPVPGKYIVVLAPAGARSSSGARRAGGPSVSGVAAEMKARFGITSIDHVYEKVLGGFSARMSEARTRALANDPRVAYVEDDGFVTVAATQVNPPVGLDRVDQRNLPLSSSYSYDTVGSGVVVYVVDTGARVSHDDFGGRAQFGFDDTGNGPGDCNGHGTAVASVAGGSRWGAAKGVNIFTVEVLDCDGTGDWAHVIRGIEWVAARPENRRVGILSLTGPPSQAVDDALTAPVTGAVAQGAFFSVAAGNEGADACGFSPARALDVMTVGESGLTDARSPTSNFGTCLDLFAPGTGITAASNASDSSVATLSGTSMAAAHVGGAAALYWAGHPGDTPAQVASGLLANATSGVITDPAGSPNLLLYTPGLFTCPANAGAAAVTGSQTIPAQSSATVTVNVTGGNPPFSVSLANGSGTQSGSGPTFSFVVSPVTSTTYSVQSISDNLDCSPATTGNATVQVNFDPSVPTLSGAGLGLLVLSLTALALVMMRRTRAE
jgi:subtilisin family serine protease